MPIETEHRINGSVSITRDDFNHPMLQTGVMFAAEFCCLLVYIFYDFLNKILTGPDEKVSYISFLMLFYIFTFVNLVRLFLFFPYRCN